MISYILVYKLEKIKYMENILKKLIKFLILLVFPGSEKIKI